VVLSVLLDDGERIIDGAGVSFEEFVCVEPVSSPSVTHFRLADVGAD
jgi:hypothetical protein